jgi:uncharacterized protein YndB with AHSA1/START domain
VWFDVEEMGPEFCERSKFKLVNESVMPVSPARAFEIITDGDSMGRWLVDFVACRWTSADHRGVGATREIELKMLTVRERFIVWEPGKRFTFTAWGMTVPLVHKFMEDLQLREIEPNKTLVTWSVHYEPRLLVRPLDPVLRSVFGKLFARSAERLAKYAGEKS